MVLCIFLHTNIRMGHILTFIQDVPVRSVLKSRKTSKEMDINYISMSKSGLHKREGGTIWLRAFLHFSINWKLL
jgi:hypothetical protein